MNDLDQILPLWRELHQAGTEYVLATVVGVEGSGYRKPGALMLIASDGRRAGTISGGCLEAEVVRKAFWHTGEGPAMRRYSTSPEDGDVPFGMGCGGVVHVLLERSRTASPMLERIGAHYTERTALAVATVLEGPNTGQRAFWPPDAATEPEPSATEYLRELARESFREQSSFVRPSHPSSSQTSRLHAGWIPPRPGLHIFGAGDDALPLVRLARQMGWYVSVSDGRSHLATNARFPEAHAVHLLPPGDFLVPSLLPSLRPTDACALLTHSLEQDTRIVAALLEEEVAYIGVLGPRRRTVEILESLAKRSGLPASEIDSQIESWLQRLHAPMGLDLGGDTPASVALSTVAEIQQTRNRTTGRPLSEIRSFTPEQRRILA